MDKKIIFVGEGGDVSANDVIDEIIEFAGIKNSCPIYIRRANKDLDSEIGHELLEQNHFIVIVKNEYK
jgi:hypothetical protein